MGEQYIRQVSRKLNLSRSRKKEILHDLEELFAEAASHGETEEEVIKRLGSPEEYANECQRNLSHEVGKKNTLKKRGIAMVVTLIVALACMFPYLSIHLQKAPEGAIGYADAATGIFLVGKSAFFNENLLLIIGILLVIMDIVLLIVSVTKYGKKKN